MSEYVVERTTSISATPEAVFANIGNLNCRMTGEQTLMVKIMSLFGKSMDKMVGPDFEKGLAKLKRITES